MKPIIALLLLFSAAATTASAVTTIVSFTPNLAIPDNSSVGVADIRTITSEVQYIYSVEVTLTITGGFNGDYYVYLQHGSGLSVLMNRVGVTATENLGYADSGAFVTFAQGAVNGDIHAYQDVSNPAGAPITGTWQPDGRTTNPLAVLNTDARPADLNVFYAGDANGDWTLFVADRSSGATGTVESWSLTINGAVPEPSSVMLMGLGALGVLKRKRNAKEVKNSAQRER